MKPHNEHQRFIAARIDAKAKEIRAGMGRWDARQIREAMLIATPFDWNESVSQFFMDYLAWRQDRPQDFYLHNSELSPKGEPKWI